MHYKLVFYILCVNFLFWVILYTMARRLREAVGGTAFAGHFI